jgi:hypothetical protein
MGRRVLLIVFVVVLVILVYLGYHSYDGKRAGASGNVFPRGTAVEKVITDTTRMQNDQPTESEKVVYPPTGQNQETSSLPHDNGASQTTKSMQPAPPNAPGSDTISPNPPNGMTFTGSGRYQLYRQGNITWRLDTDTGRTCVIFATEEEWKKPQVYRAGCGKS